MSINLCMYVCVYIYIYMPTQEGGERIRTSDLHFMSRGPKPIKLPIGD